MMAAIERSHPPGSGPRLAPLDQHPYGSVLSIPDGMIEAYGHAAAAVWALVARAEDIYGRPLAYVELIRDVWPEHEETVLRAVDMLLDADELAVGLDGHVHLDPDSAWPR